MLLEKWNAKVNLTASTAWSAVGPLFVEAVWAAGRYEAKAARHLDIGSGAGFPALLLRILVPDMRLAMVEARAKRCSFLETAACELGLENVRVINMRLDSYLESEEGPWDCVSWKGVRPALRDIRTLAVRSGRDARFWMFHGRELAVKDPDALERVLELVRTESCPAMEGWHLSIYRRKEGEGCFT